MTKHGSVSIVAKWCCIPHVEPKSRLTFSGNVTHRLANGHRRQSPRKRPVDRPRISTPHAAFVRRHPVLIPSPISPISLKMSSPFIPPVNRFGHAAPLSLCVRRRPCLYIAPLPLSLSLCHLSTYLMPSISHLVSVSRSSLRLSHSRVLPQSHSVSPNFTASTLCWNCNLSHDLDQREFQSGHPRVGPRSADVKQSTSVTQGQVAQW